MIKGNSFAVQNFSSNFQIAIFIFRFTDAMSDKNLMAALLHPLFKSYHIFDDYPELKSRLIKKLAVELQPTLDAQLTGLEEDSQQPAKNMSDITNMKKFRKLFDFNMETGFSGSALALSSSMNAEAIITKYISSPITSFHIFDLFPEVAKLFIKHNTPLCSSAASERLFSLAKRVLTAQRCRLLDKHFETQLLLKVNLFPSQLKKYLREQKNIYVKKGDKTVN